MLVLYETSLGFCLFKVTDAGKLQNPKALWKELQTPEKANGLLKLRALHRFSSTAAAVEDLTAIQEGKIPKGLKQLLTTEILEKEKEKEVLAVADTKLAKAISKKLGIEIYSKATQDDLMDLYRGIRDQITSLLGGVDQKDLTTMSLGLSHSLSRYKLKFSPDKVDVMVVQAISLLDDLDKEINIYSMRVKEWYGWHFPEMGKIIVDNLAYANVVRTMGVRTNAANITLANILPEDLEAAVKLAAEISMGTEISDSDIAHIHSLCDQVIAISAYRTQLADYLRNRMNAIAPNLTALVGELVGARLISHAGSLRNLAKHPASTVQILGAEKALFRALKTKHDTPKYGLIYHASLIGQAPPKLKGKMARMVATKAALSIRVDALSDADTKSGVEAATIGLENRAKLESRLRALEYRSDLTVTKAFSGERRQEQPKFEMKGGAKTYNTAADAVGFMPTQRKDAEKMAIDAVLEVKEERRKEKEEKRRAKEEKKSKKATATAENNMAVDEAEPTKVPNETEEERKEKKRLKKEKKAAETAASFAANIAASTSAATNSDEPSLEKEKRKKSKKRAVEDIEMEEAGEPEKKKKKRRKDEE
ncbi:Nucleolar protein 58 [Serendipita sp. 411]|nr:Nucleolar protein 58 [Serendipita sp. 401]KAG8835623.1 Nucleolar protein 58 [Serendipita sp. 400]KAG8854491.1 Nucleolar protein 58 [Serendipita sp. 411]KAG9054850.1 Nucleolar protein 58 [Serendipita sp. 407]